MKQLSCFSNLQSLFKRHNVAVAYLFGSQAHGTAGVLSDIDIAVAFDRNINVEERKQKLAALTADLSITLKTEKIDVLDLLSTTDPLLKHRAVFSAECLYAVNPRVRFQLERSIMQAYEDTRNLRSTQYRLMQQRIKNGTFATAKQVSPYLQKILQK